MSAYLVLREEGTTNQAYCPQEALRESKWVCPQLLERAGQSVHWLGESWETTQVPWPFLGTQLLEGEGLEWFLERGGGLHIFQVVAIGPGTLTSLAKGSFS